MVSFFVDMRSASVKTVEAIAHWRSHIGSEHEVFIWSQRNYLLKMCRDLDFLSKIPSLLQALGVEASTLRSNPFCMPQNLHQSQGLDDTSGNIGGSNRHVDQEYERIRRGEEVLRGAWDRRNCDQPLVSPVLPLSVKGAVGGETEYDGYLLPASGRSSTSPK